MKKIILTERQYNNLIRKNLFEGIVYEDKEDANDVPIDLKVTLTIVSDLLYSTYGKDLFVKSVKDGIVTLNSEKYSTEEKKFLIDTFNKQFKKSTQEDEKFKDEDKLVIDYGIDTDFEDYLAGFEAEKQKRIELEKIKQKNREKTSSVSSSGEFKGIPNYWLPLVKLIAKGESSSFTSLYPSTTLEDKGLENGTSETIRDVKDFLIKKGMSDNAVGRWQIKNLISQSIGAGLDPENDLFSVENQNKILLYLIEKKRGVTPQTIKSDLNGSAKKLAQEWSSLPVLEDTQGSDGGVSRGYSYYGGKTKITPEDFEKVLSEIGNVQYNPSNESSSNSNIGGLVIRLLNGGNPIDKELNYYPKCINQKAMCIGGKDGDWNGSLYKAASIAYYLNICDSSLKPSSQKRSDEYSDDKNVSDHWEKSNDSYAIDFPVSGEEAIKKGTKAFYCLRDTIVKNGILSKEDAEKKIIAKKGHYSTFNSEGYRYQILWLSDSKHENHIHIGVRKN